MHDFKALGVTWIRFDLNWSIVQPTNAASYDWTEYDNAIALANSYGMHVDVIVDYPAAWASTSGCAPGYGIHCQPQSPELYGTFAAAVARHFGSKIGSIEIWNEPNNAEFWAPAPDPVFYTTMLQDAFTAIKAADPQMVVVTGGLADTSHGINPVTFVQDLYAEGAKGYFDAVGDHPYSYPALPGQYERWSGWSEMAQTTPSVRSVMDANGDANVPIWMTEVGAPTGGPGGTAACNATGAFSTIDTHDGPCRQALDIAEVVHAEKALPWAGPAFIYSYEDVSSNPDSVQNFFGIKTATGVNKPSYAALQKAIATNP